MIPLLGAGQLPLERRGNLRDGGGASDEGATEIECQHKRCCHHDEGGTGVGPVRGEERGRYAGYADPGRMRLSTMRRPTQSTDLLLEPTLTSFRLSSTPSTSRSRKSLRTVESAGTHVGSTSARPWATSSSGSNPLVPLCGRSTSDPLPSDGLTKNSSSFSTPTATQDVTQSVNHQLAPLCQPSGALFRLSPIMVQKSVTYHGSAYPDVDGVPLTVEGGGSESLLVSLPFSFRQPVHGRRGGP